MATSTPTLTANYSIVPAVQIALTGLLATGTVTVYRIADGTSEVVRNASNVSASSTFTVVDYDAPIGVVVTYTAENFDSSVVSQGVSSPATITLTSTSIWMHDPLAPANNVEIKLTGTSDVVLGANSFTRVARGYDIVTTKVLGKTRPTMQFYGLKGYENLTFELITTVYGTTDVMGLLATNPVLVRFPTNFPNLPTRINGALTAEQEPLTWMLENTPVTQFYLKLNEVEPQSLGIVYSIYSYSYWSGKYATYTAASAVYGSNTYDYSVLNPPV
jgi:hypothetical protein